MISFDNLLWSPCVSQACQRVGVCQEWGYAWEGPLCSSQLGFQLPGLWASVKLSGNREEELCCPCVCRLRRLWLSCSGRCRSQLWSLCLTPLLPQTSLCSSVPIFGNYNLIDFFRGATFKGLQKPFFECVADLFVPHSRLLNYIWLKCIWEKNKIHTCI